MEALEPAAAAAAEAFSTIFSSDSEGTLGTFAVHFGRRWHEIRWCFGAKELRFRMAR